jgi:hypothetical protein
MVGARPRYHRQRTANAQAAADRDITKLTREVGPEGLDGHTLGRGYGIVDDDLHYLRPPIREMGQPVRAKALPTCPPRLLGDAG